MLRRLHSVRSLGLGQWVDFTLSVMVSTVRLGCGNWVACGIENCHRPEKDLILLDCEGCDGSRRVREALSTLGLDCVVFPTPLRAPSSRAPWQDNVDSMLSGCCDEVQGQPVLMDPNVQSLRCGGRQQTLVGAGNIISYLWRVYGSAAKKPWNYIAVSRLETAPFMLGSLYRTLPTLLRPLPAMGNALIVAQVASAAESELPQLFGCENCPHTRRVRELLCSMQVPYVQRTIARGCLSNRADFMGKFPVSSFWAPWQLGLLTVPVLSTDGAPGGLRGLQRIMKYIELRYGPQPEARPEVDAEGICNRAREVFRHGARATIPGVLKTPSQKQPIAVSVTLTPPYYAGSA
jgi:hypothetical protein